MPMRERLHRPTCLSNVQNARTQYLERQRELRNDLKAKQDERNSGKIADEFMWGVPDYSLSFPPLVCILSAQTVQAPELGDFWQKNLKVQVEARSGILRLHDLGMELGLCAQSMSSYHCSQTRQNPRKSAAGPKRNPCSTNHPSPFMGISILLMKWVSSWI